MERFNAQGGFLCSIRCFLCIIRCFLMQRFHAQVACRLAQGSCLDLLTIQGSIGVGFCFASGCVLLGVGGHLPFGISNGLVAILQQGLV